MSIDRSREIEKVCAERGLRLTPLRMEVLQLVAASALPVKAYDVLARIRESTATSSPPTVYRSLDFLLEHGFIHKLGSINAFVACRAPRTIHTAAFLICDRCGAASELIEDPLRQLLDHASRALNFLPHARSQTLEIHGVCAECSS